MSYVVTAKKEALNAARAVANSVALEDVHFLEIKAVRVAGKLPMPVQPVFAFETTEHRLETSGDKKYLDVLVRFSVHFYEPNEDEEDDHDNGDHDEGDALAVVDLLVCLRYRRPLAEIPEAIQSRGIPAFCSINGPYNAWPYFRQQVQTATTTLGLPAYVLPPMVVEQEREEPPPKDPTSE